jgi:hypothetical protein
VCTFDQIQQHTGFDAAVKMEMLFDMDTFDLFGYVYKVNWMDAAAAVSRAFASCGNNSVQNFKLGTVAS